MTNNKRKKLMKLEVACIDSHFTAIDDMAKGEEVKLEAFGYLVDSGSVCNIVGFRKDEGLLTTISDLYVSEQDNKLHIARVMFGKVTREPYQTQRFDINNYNTDSIIPSRGINKMVYDDGAEYEYRVKTLKDLAII